MEPWSNLYDVDEWWENKFSKMIADTKDDLLDKFIKEAQNLIDNDDEIEANNFIEMEKQAWDISNSHDPKYLNLTESEIEKIYENYINKMHK